MDTSGEIHFGFEWDALREVAARHRAGRHRQLPDRPDEAIGEQSAVGEGHSSSSQGSEPDRTVHTRQQILL